MAPGSPDPEENEGLLAAEEYELKSPGDESPRPPPPGRRLGSSVAMLLLVVATIVFLGGLTLSGIAMQQGQSQQEQQPPSEQAGDAGKPSEQQDSGGSKQRTSIIPPPDDFDLKKTNFFISNTDAEIREYVFNVTRAVVEGPDGVNKSMILVNGQSPGPLIEANSGDLIKVLVHNSLPEGEPTTIHWHGIDQRDSVHMDGVHGVTQCGIPSGESFTYVFGVPQQRGTFWYHAHVSVQYTDGFYGSLIIHDPDEKVPPTDEDRIIMMGDMHHMDGRTAVSEYLSSSPSWSPMMAGMEPYPDNIIINGRHVFNCTKQPEMTKPSIRGRHEMGGVSKSDTASKCTIGSLFTSRIKSKTSARLRLISHSSNTPLWFTIDNHTLEVVEIDGTEIEPIATTKVYLNPGQRYSVILQANQTAGNYLMRAAAACAMLDSSPESNLTTVDNQATGILSYDNVDAGDAPIGKPWSTSDTIASPDVGKEPWATRCQDLPFDLTKPMRKVDAYEVGDRNQHYFKFIFVDDGKGVQRTSINGSIFSPLENDATIWQAAKQNITAANLDSAKPDWAWKPEQHVLVSRDEGKGAQVAISAGNMMGHPWHLHGQQFQIVGWGRGEFGRSKTTWNLNNPLRRDTVTVPGHSHVVIRFAADNPGVWALHCHIQWHAEGGMFVQTAQRLSALQKLIEGQGMDDARNKFCSPR